MREATATAHLAAPTKKVSVEGFGRIAWLSAAGCLMLVAGILVYLTDRGTSPAMLIPTIGTLTNAHLFGPLGPWLPSFAHTFAFSLFTAAALPKRSALGYGGCALWAAVNIAFELGQHPQLSGRIAEALQRSLFPAWLSQLLAGYFLRGTFDRADIAAAASGALAAALVLRLIDRRAESSHGQ